jgi:hypothetical protein
MPLNNPTSEGAKCTSGSYTGNSSANRAIPHGLGYAPKWVYIYEDRGSEVAYVGILHTGYSKYLALSPTPGIALTAAVTAADTTNFYVGNAGDYVGTMNYNAYVYYWVAVY